MAPADTLPVPDPTPVIHPLLATLEREHEALQRVEAALDAQLEALRLRSEDTFRLATDDAADAVAELGRLRTARERQLRLAGRVVGLGEETTLAALIGRMGPGQVRLGEQLAAARERLRRRADAVQQRCAELEFALGVAVRLGRELMRAWQAPDAGGRTYTATGAARTTTPRALLDQTG